MDGAPWQMPAVDEIKTRVEEPWEDEKDAPAAVVSLLAAEAIRRLQLSTDVAARLQHRVVEQRKEILGKATAEQMAYEEARAEHMPRAHRARDGALWRSMGRLMNVLVAVILVLGSFRFVWQTSAALEFPPVVRVLLFAVPGALLVAPKRWLLPDLIHAGMMMVFLFMAAGGLGWQAAHWFAGSDGITAKLVVVSGMCALAVLGVAAVGGIVLVNHFDEEHSREPTQRAFDQWLDALYGKGILPAAAQAANDPGPVFSTSLQAPAASYVDPKTAVDFETAATAEVRLLLKRTNGSFALAGPRGAGKTTLMDLWCAGRYLDHVEDAGHLAVKVDAPVGYDPKEFVVYLFGRLCDAVDKRMPVDGPKRGWFQRVERERKMRRDNALSPAELGDLARRERKAIRSLQSRTTERETGLEINWLAKLTGKHKSLIRHDDLPLGYPELVDRFRDFLRRTAELVGRQQGTVLVGVDELDRISDGVQAERFLNELKAVFDVPNCFFLVSVSDDALADFELAAMGMRTVFDSAFDAVVRVDYLTFREARTLLNRRVVNLPEQFAALAYVLSGGLARELVRVVEVIGTKSGELYLVTELLARQQLKRTLRAARDRIMRLSDPRAGAKLVSLLDSPPRDLRTLVVAIEAAEVREAADATRLEVVVMIEYLAVLLDVFDNRLDEVRMANGLSGGPGGFDSLAKVRRYLGANPYAARELLAAFDKAWA